MKKKTWSIAALGLTEIEMMLLKSMTGLTRGRDGDQYAVNDMAGNCNILILNTDDPTAVDQWRVLAEKTCLSETVFFSAKPPADTSQHHLLRPFSPAKLLLMLDGIVKRLHEVEQIWAGPTPTPTNAVAGAVTVLRALVVDDSPTVCRQLEQELRNFSIQADLAETGEYGLELLRANNYDLIFLDVVLPGTDGYQICKEIRKDPKTKEMPVIMLTSKSSPFDRVRGMLVGCSAYLTKPVDFKIFSETIKKYSAAQAPT